MIRALLATLLLLVAIPVVQAQGVAPGGPIGGSTGIGSGLGNVPGGTGPSYPNGTTAPPSPTPIPPGGYPPVGHFDSARPATSAPPAASIGTPSHYPQPQEPFAASVPQPLLKLPQDAASSAAFMDGCWRTDLFSPSAASQQGVVTYCFDANGIGRLLFRRLDQSSNYSCTGPAAVRYEGQQLHITTPDTSCTGGDRSFPTTLDCVKAADRTAQCGSEAATVHLHFVGALRAKK